MNYLLFDFFTNHGRISAESITITKNSLVNSWIWPCIGKLMYIISISAQAVIFLRNCAKRFLKTFWICLVLDSVSFYKKRFLVGRRKLTFGVSNFCQMKKAKKNFKLSSFVSFLSHHNRTCFFVKIVCVFFSSQLHFKYLYLPSLILII